MTRGIYRSDKPRTFPDSLSLSPAFSLLDVRHEGGRRPIEAAIENKEPILIYGDYDVDGTTAIVILKTAIELCGGAADFHVPHRIRDGYDMRDDVIERAGAAGIRLIISVDMGIRAFAPAETARRLGVDLIVTDHHLPGPKVFRRRWPWSIPISQAVSIRARHCAARAWLSNWPRG